MLLLPLMLLWLFRAPLANSTGGAFRHTEQVVLPRATLCAAFLLRLCKEKKSWMYMPVEWLQYTPVSKCHLTRGE